MRIGRLAGMAVLALCLCACRIQAEEETPFRAYLRAQSLDDTLDSVSTAFSLRENTEGASGKSGKLHTSKRKTVFDKGAVLQNETAILATSMDGSGRPSTTRLFLYYRDGYNYMRVVSRRMDSFKSRQAGNPPPAALFPPPRDTPFLAFPEEFVDKQEREGNTLRFFLNPEAVNAWFAERNIEKELLEARVEVALDDAGAIVKVTGTGAYRSPGDDGAATRYTAVREILQRGGVTVDFPVDLDTYEDSGAPAAEK